MKSERELIYKGRIISLVAEYDQQSKKTYDIIIHPGAVVMVPVDIQGNLMLVKQFRQGSDQILIELPAGTLEENEDPVQCANRELQEEIGYKAEEIIPLGGFFTAPGFCNEYLYLYLAHKLVVSPLIGDDTDEIEVISISLEKCLDMIEKGEIIDAKTIVGIYRYEKWMKS